MASDGITPKALTNADCVRLKAEGNTAYAAGEIDSAILSYTEAIDIWDNVVRSSPQPQALEVGDRVLYELETLTVTVQTGNLFGEITKAFPLVNEYFIKDLHSEKNVWENGNENGSLRCFDRADLVVVSTEMFDVQLACLQNLAAAYLKMGLHDEAVNWADNALAMHPYAPKALMRKGVALLRGGVRLSRAQRVLALANKVSPNDREVQKALEEVKKLRAARKEIPRPVDSLKSRMKNMKFKPGCVCPDPSCVEPSSDENDYKAPPKEKKVLETRGADFVLKSQKEYVDSRPVPERLIENSKPIDLQVGPNAKASVQLESKAKASVQVEPKAVAKPAVDSSTSQEQAGRSTAPPLIETKEKAPVQTTQPEDNAAKALFAKSLSTRQSEMLTAFEHSAQGKLSARPREVRSGSDAEDSDSELAAKQLKINLAAIKAAQEAAKDKDSELAAQQLKINLAAIKAAQEATKDILIASGNWGPSTQGSLDGIEKSAKPCGTQGSPNGIDKSAKPCDTSRSTFRHFTWQCASIAGAAGAIFSAIAWSWLVAKT